MNDSAMSMSAEEASLAATQAMVDAHTKSQSLLMGKMQAMYAGVGLPGQPGK